MSNVYEIAENAVSGLGYPYAREHYEPDSSGQLPESYITYDLITSRGATWADGRETSQQHRIRFNFFTTHADLLKTVPGIIHDAVIAAGFTGGQWRDYRYDKKTSHEGVHSDFYYFERSL